MRAFANLIALTLLGLGPTSPCRGQRPLPPPLPPMAEATADSTARDRPTTSLHPAPGRAERHQGEGFSAAAQAPAKLLPADQAQALQRLLEYLVRQNLPRSHVDEDDWGRTKRVYAGFRITRDDWKLSTKRRWKEVKHGRWQRFSVELLDPDNLEHLRVGAQVLSWDAEAGQLRTRLTVDCTLGLFARRMRYNYGVRLFSIHAEGTAQARLTLDAAITVGLDYESLPPAVAVTPLVEDATLTISEFHLKRLSHLHGDPAEWAGEVVDEWVQKKWLPEQNEKLADRMNRQIQSEIDEGSLRFSMSDWLQRRLQP
ncbi:hypothetical protein [Roseimaritima ulvae]|uniref:Uncharacterized protein n=1 Tax=Roseimaritima ulvae TaxID=980254 RepID=A0A5B9QZV5_9BACT|nr:hypothetical protein [Roseimaritima ulvae]QEG43529.1 hypothetical protein UC8_55800 [Roseimaritima ulvae]